MKAWKRTWDSLREVESLGDLEAAARPRLLLACRRFMAISGIPRLARLAELVRPEMTAQELLTVLVPVERVAARVRVTDAELGITGDDRSERSTFPLHVVADNIRSALNLGGLFRTADALGAKALWLCGYSATPQHRNVCRSALGAERALPWRQWNHIRDAIDALKAAGIAVCALETSTHSEPVELHHFAFPCAILIGSERFGLDPDVLAAADARLRIDMFGTKNSLNVVSALAVAGYAARWRWTRTECQP